MELNYKATKTRLVDKIDSSFIDNLTKAKRSEIESFINNCLRQTSPKTGRLIKVNVYKWKKSDMIDLIEEAGYVSFALDWINNMFYSSLEVYEVEELTPVKMHQA